MTNADADKWNNIYRSGDHGSRQACQVLTDHVHLLPDAGTALDLACGMGGNAILLAKHGLTTSAWDISATAIARLDDVGRQLDLTIETRVVDVTREPPPSNSFDVIVVSHFLERQLVPHIKMAIRPGGLIFYQTFIKKQIIQTGPKNPDYLLGDNELLRLFHDFHILAYREDGATGNPARGFRNEAMLVAQQQAARHEPV